MTDTAVLTGQDIGEAEGAMTALLEPSSRAPDAAAPSTSRCACSPRGRRTRVPPSWPGPSPVSASLAWTTRARWRCSTGCAPRLW